MADWSKHSRAIQVIDSARRGRRGWIALTLLLGPVLLVLGYAVATGAPEPDWSVPLAAIAAVYLTAIGEHHLVLQSVVRSSHRARAIEADVLFYLAPVNVEDLATCCGDDASGLRRNTRVVIDTLERAGAEHVLDLSSLLGASMFDDKQWSCEHLTAPGRRRVASRLAEYMRAHRLVPGAPAG